MNFLLAKNTKFHIFADRSLKPHTRVSQYAESDGVILIKVLWLLRDVSPFLKVRLISSGS